jgi:hypothetical protein
MAATTSVWNGPISTGYERTKYQCLDRDLQDWKASYDRQCVD